MQPGWAEEMSFQKQKKLIIANSWPVQADVIIMQ